MCDSDDILSLVDKDAIARGGLMKLASKLLILITFVVGVSCASTNSSIVSRGGVVKVTNASGEQIEVFVDGSRFVVMEPGDVDELDKIISGRRLLRATGVDSGLFTEREFDLEIGSAQEWVVTRFSVVAEGGPDSATTGSIDVDNTLDAAVVVTVPDQGPRTVPPGVRLRISGIPFGLISVSAVVEGTDLSFATDLHVKNGAVPVFAINQPSRAIRVENRSGRPAVLQSSTHSPKLIPDGRAVVLDSIVTDQVDLVVLDTARRVLASLKVQTVAGKVIDVVVNRPAGVLKIVSDVDEDVSIYADGVLAGSCAARGGATIQGLVPGRNNLRAVDAAGTTVSVALIEIGSEPALWLLDRTGSSMMAPGTGGIEVTNTSREKTMVYLDGALQGPIGAGGRMLYPSIPPGDHEVVVIGQSVESFARATITVHESAVVSWKAIMPGATLSVRNDGTEAVNVFCDGRQLGSVEAGATSAFPVVEGTHRIDIAGIRSASSVVRETDFPAGATTSVVYSGQFATVVITNMFSDAVEVRIDERVLGILKPGERVTVSDVRPGTLRLSAQSTDRPVSSTATVTLLSGEAYDWTVNP